MRKESREKVFQTLFMMDALGIDAEHAIPLFKMTAESPASDESYYRETVEGVWQNLDEVDRLIGSAAANWRIERRPLVDRNILRLGAYEICHSPD
ncbi:MAG TPA: transcription antitermination factor NusB, partial [Candidatus Deferrimicrobiaceae bacterium]